MINYVDWEIIRKLSPCRWCEVQRVLRSLKSNHTRASARTHTHIYIYISVYVVHYRVCVLCVSRWVGQVILWITTTVHVILYFVVVRTGTDWTGLGHTLHRHWCDRSIQQCIQHGILINSLHVHNILLLAVWRYIPLYSHDSQIKFLSN